MKMEVALPASGASTFCERTCSASTEITSPCMQMAITGDRCAAHTVGAPPPDAHFLLPVPDGHDDVHPRAVRLDDVVPHEIADAVLARESQRRRRALGTQQHVVVVGAAVEVEDAGRRPDAVPPHVGLDGRRPAPGPARERHVLVRPVHVRALRSTGRAAGQDRRAADCDGDGYTNLEEMGGCDA